MKVSTYFRWLPIAVVVITAPCTPILAGTAKSREPGFVVPVVPEVQIPQSVFVVPSQPSDGRNPFFPQSRVGFQAAPPSTKPHENVIDTSSIVLNGITSPPKRTAMINGRTFEVGEAGEVRLPNGAKALIKCEEIKTESAIILINGQRRELRLRAGV
jgi:hypothetical protein